MTGGNQRNCSPKCRAGKRLLGLDLGAKRIGVALSDPLGVTAQGLTVLPRRGGVQDLQEIKTLVEKYQVEAVVIGLPRRLSGEVGPEAQAALDFAAALREYLSIPVHTWDEWLTTVQAERLLLSADLSRKKRRRVIDKVAAAFMLENYLEAHRASENEACPEGA